MARDSALLLTGAPGVGKTTVIREVARLLDGSLRIRGFTTEEIREGRERVGFHIETFDGERVVLAHVSIRSPHRVSKYGVDVETLDRIVGSALGSSAGADLYLVDEIGKMECFSESFVRALERLLDAGCLLVATVALRGEGFIERVKERSDVEIWRVTRKNREELPRRVIAWLGTRGEAPAPSPERGSGR